MVPEFAVFSEIEVHVLSFILSTKASAGCLETFLTSLRPGQVHCSNFLSESSRLIKSMNSGVLSPQQIE